MEESIPKQSSCGHLFHVVHPGMSSPTPSVVPGPIASVLPGGLLGMQILRLTLDLLNQSHLGWGPEICLNKLSS